jgi:hypothetical protein
VTLLVFLARSARTRLVAAHFGGASLVWFYIELIPRLRLTACWLLPGRRRVPERRRFCMLKLQRSGGAASLSTVVDIFGALDLHPAQHADRVPFYLVKHQSKHLESFAFVFLLWIFLRV